MWNWIKWICLIVAGILLLIYIIISLTKMWTWFLLCPAAVLFLVYFVIEKNWIVNSINFIKSVFKKS